MAGETLSPKENEKADQLYADLKDLKQRRGAHG